MSKLKDIKNFGELYESVGDKNFGYVAYALATLLAYLPLGAGVINFVMYTTEPYYNVYDYNFKCMTMWNIVFTLMLIWFMTYLLGKIHINKWNTKGLYLVIKDRQKWLLFWLALLAWTIIPICFSPDPMGAVWGGTFLGSGYISHIYTLGLMMCVYLIKENNQRERLIWHFIVSTDVLAMIMLAFEYDIPVLRAFTLATGVSVYTNSNHYGYIIAMASLAIVGMYYKELNVDKKNRNRLKICLAISSFIINIYALMINDTLGAYLAIVFAMIVILPIWRYRTGKFHIQNLVPFFIIIVFTVLSYTGFITSKLGSTIGPSLVTFFQDLFKVRHKTAGYKDAGTGRIALWLETIDRICERPIVGYGPDIIIDKSNRVLLSNTPHNEFLECAFALGIPGLILYLGGLFGLCIKKCRDLKRISITSLIAAGVVISYLASSFFGVRKFNTVCYFFMFVGILMREENLDRKDDGLSLKKN